MVRSLVVVVGIVAVLIFMVPRASSVSRPPVDVHTNAVAVAGETGWPVEEPRGLPSGWDATAVRFVRSTDGLQTWIAGYCQPVRRAMPPSSQAIERDARVGRGRDHRAAPQVGETTAGGRTWTEYDRPDKTQNSLVHRPTPVVGLRRLTTIITGTGTFEELTFFAGHRRGRQPLLRAPRSRPARGQSSIALSCACARSSQPANSGRPGPRRASTGRGCPRGRPGRSRAARRCRSARRGPARRTGRPRRRSHRRRPPAWAVPARWARCAWPCGPA